MRICLPASCPTIPRRSPAIPRVLLLGPAVLLGCLPELPPRRGPGADAASGSPQAPTVELDPPAPLDAAPAVLRARLRLPGLAAAGVDLDRVVLVEGEIGEAHLRQIVRGEISKALSERLVPALAWIEQPATDELLVILAPTRTLTPGQTYAVASGAPELAEHLRVAEDAPPPLLRWWPPEGLSETATLGIWCGSELLPAIDAPGALEPAGPAGDLRRGVAGELGGTCVRFEAAAGQESEGPWVGPPALELGGGARLSLDPRPFAVEASAPEPAAAACQPGEAPFGPGCAAVADDRILVRSPEAPTLWAVAGEGLDLVVAAGPGEPFLIAPLPPLSAIALEVVAVDAAGRASRATFTAITLAPMPHVVINEVLANPIGPEPEQEWVELYNDGLVAAALGGHVIVDVGGETALPEATLAPGEHALVVNEAFVEDDELDPPPAPGTQLLRVPQLGKSGLANGGEPLRLKDASGAVVSRSPAMAASKAGMSLSRVSPRSPDGPAASFVQGWPTPGQENKLEMEAP